VVDVPRKDLEDEDGYPIAPALEERPREEAVAGSRVKVLVCETLDGAVRKAIPEEALEDRERFAVQTLMRENIFRKQTDHP